MSIVIRAYEPRDQAAVIEHFFRLKLLEEPVAGNPRANLKRATESLMAALQYLSRTQGAAIVAEMGGEVVGHLFLIFENDAIYAGEELREYAYVSELFVREEARRKGIGKLLLREAERLTRSRGVRRLAVAVLMGNVGAKSLYTEFGFVPHAIELTKEI